MVADAEFAKMVEPYRRELRAHCYRMAGSLHDADDLLQESLLRAWRGLAGFEGRASLRTWLYKVATHACLDKLASRGPRLLPADMGPASEPSAVGPPIEDAAFVEPAPAELYERRETVALAFMVALQLLTPKQRAALILHDVVGMEASESAELLGMSTAAVNSALQRAREVLASRRITAPAPDPAQVAVLARYVDAWERSDSSALVALLREDATLAMPPIREWIVGARSIGASIEAMVFGPAGAGAFKLVATEANGLPAFAAYAQGHALGLHVLELHGGAIASITAFLTPSLFPKFGFPAMYTASAPA
jgi:RNA polymerase sigma-70 factor (ECF subfamily)